MTSKKILYVASTSEHLDRFHRDYILALRSEGYAVETLARGSRDYDIPFEKRIFSLKNLLLIPKIRRIIRRGGYRAIILNTSLASFYTRLACPKRNRPRTVNIVHGYLFSEGDLSLKSLILLTAERLLRHKTDAILTMNAEDTRLAEKFRLTKGEILEIRGMGAEIRRQITPPEAIRQEFFKNGAFVLTFVGELSKRKNQRLLIEALKIIKKDLPEAVLCLVGDGNERENLERLAASLGLRESVLFVGKRQDACDFIRAADVYVSAAKIEGLPFNIIEAMGAAKTVVASRIKGHADIIDDGRDGFLFDAENAESLANTVLKIHRGEASVSQKSILKKHAKYEKSAVFSDTFSAIKSAARLDYDAF